MSAAFQQHSAISLSLDDCRTGHIEIDRRDTYIPFTLVVSSCSLALRAGGANALCRLPCDDVGRDDGNLVHTLHPIAFPKFISDVSS